MVRDFTGQQTNDDATEIQVVHAATGLGALDVLIRPKGGTGWQNIAAELAPGAVSAPVSPTAASYDVGIDLDGDGAPEHVYVAGYFPDYGFNLYVADGDDGVPRLGKHSAASSDVWWATPATP